MLPSATDRSEDDVVSDSAVRQCKMGHQRIRPSRFGLNLPHLVDHAEPFFQIEASAQNQEASV